ncbi:MAG: hypothetical protein RR068_15585, partial [Hafnia sp.]
ILKTVVVLSVLLLVTACAIRKPVEASKVIPYCDYAERIWFSSAKELDSLETDTLRQIKKHNDRVKTVCGN